MTAIRMISLHRKNREGCSRKISKLSLEEARMPGTLYPHLFIFKLLSLFLKVDSGRFQIRLDRIISIHFLASQTNIDVRN